MPDKYRKTKGPHPSGVENRNRALDWISKKVEETGDDSGVIYFADDDNTYNLRIFEEVNYSGLYQNFREYGKDNNINVKIILVEWDTQST